jgi:predicted extracellular nuclease
MSTSSRIAVLAAVIVVAIGGLVIAKGGGDDKTTSDTASTTTPTATDTSTTRTETTTSETTTSTTTTKPAGPPTFRVTVSGGKPAGGIEKIKVNKGDRVNLVVKSDVADEIHIHGYDLMKDVAAGGSVRFGFKATIDGAFEIELEGRGEQIASLTVEP